MITPKIILLSDTTDSKLNNIDRSSSLASKQGFFAVYS